jgi:dynein heavy chain
LKKLKFLFFPFKKKIKLFFFRNTFFNLTKTVLQDVLKNDIYKLLEHLSPKNDKLADIHVRNLLFGDYFKADSDNKIYDEISDLDGLSKVMEG